MGLPTLQEHISLSALEILCQNPTGVPSSWGHVCGVGHSCRLGKYFLKLAKNANGDMGLAESCISFFKTTGGVGTRRAFLPPKTAALRNVQKGGRSKSKGPQSKKLAPCLFGNVQHCFCTSSTAQGCGRSFPK